LGHETWISLSEKGKSKICKLAKKEDFDEEFKSSFPVLNEIDAMCELFGKSAGSFEQILAENKLVNAVFNSGSYSTLVRTLPSMFESYCYVEFGDDDSCCIITNDQGYVYTDAKSHTVIGVGALYARFKDRYDELIEEMMDLSDEYFHSSGYDFIYEHYYGK